MTFQNIDVTGSALLKGLRRRVISALKTAHFDTLVIAQPENVTYVTGYDSVLQSLKQESIMVAALNADGDLYLAAPSGDAGAAMYEDVVPADRYFPWGRFFFDSTSNVGRVSLSSPYESLQAAASAMLETAGVGTVLGVDRPAAAMLNVQLDCREWLDASEWIEALRASKTEGEIELLSLAASVTEEAIEKAIELVRPGIKERELARQIGGCLGEAGAHPRFIVVTSGERSALSDTYPTNRMVQMGDLVRFDVGCRIQGYMSDIGRTVVVGAADRRQRQRYEAILAGEQAQLDAARPGIRCSDLFDVAVRAVESHGVAPYRRHHCGHAIGRESYERPIIGPEVSDELVEAMTFCFETPFYELGWGGMMVEDEVVITAEGCRMLTSLDRDLPRCLTCSRPKRFQWPRTVPRDNPATISSGAQIRDRQF